ncbi:probable low affinity copper uptake protein 2 isoform X2 [Octodon degus]|uniref:Copper transport protein n=1 Tax=Octodon degus TaxID=10160 RepID=A0A6P6F3I2_OCTDE|nr:probable low affinity copper uptake protein 2 isoform X2 [Octodon degus]
MAMHFIFSDKVMLLFDFWSVHSPAGMALSVLVVLLLAVLYEGIKVGKAKLLYHTLVNLHRPASQELILAREQDSVDTDSLSVSRMTFRLERRCTERSSPEPCSLGLQVQLRGHADGKAVVQQRQKDQLCLADVIYL